MNYHVAVFTFTKCIKMHVMNFTTVGDLFVIQATGLLAALIAHISQVKWRKKLKQNLEPPVGSRKRFFMLFNEISRAKKCQI